MELMVDIVSAAPWTPDDDLRLKNAVEAGASLESLAKGAVQFSRKYTLRELQDRWHSLLYDPDISAKASASMFNLEHRAPTVPSKFSGNGTKESLGESSAKRKVQSIRRQYYAMRKRFCKKMIDSIDKALHDDINIDNKTGDGSVREKDIIAYKDGKVEKDFGFQETVVVPGENNNGGSSLQDAKKDMHHLLVNDLVGYRNCSGLEEVGPSHSLPDAPLWKTIEDVTAPTMPVHVSLENKDHSAEKQLMLPDQLKDKHVTDVLDVPSAISKEEMAHLLNLTNVDELLLMDINGTDTPEKTCFDNLDSLLLNSPSEIQGNDAPDVRESQKSNKETKLPMPSDSSRDRLDSIAYPLDCSHGDSLAISNPGNDIPSTVAEQSLQCADHGDEFMYCALNTEDPEIPSNDDISSPINVPSSMTQPTNKEAGFPVSSSNNQINKEPEMSLKKEGKPSYSFTTSRMVRPGLVANINSNQPSVGVAIKTEYLGRKNSSADSRQGHAVSVSPSQSRLVHTAMKSATDGHLKEEEIDTPASAEVYAHSKADKRNDFPKTEANPLTVDQEEDNDDENDIPNFYDIETMILEMDLCPMDQDSNANREVSRYLHEDSKRAIMRLEQCAQSFVQRAIASRGAFAMLYGRNLKQYIKKREVMLGRATDDSKVDIDLGREGRANKISRQQALIRMEADGSFIIKNIGKSSIFVNGKEIVTGQMRGLGSSSLIEVRDLSFIFEINNKSVRRFLDNVDKNMDDINNKFSLLPQGGQQEDKWHRKTSS